jgi:hypothetical protein
LLLAVIAIIARSAYKLVKMTIRKDALLWIVFAVNSIVIAWTILRLGVGRARERDSVNGAAAASGLRHREYRNGNTCETAILL